MIHRILLPHDGTGASDKALMTAIDLARAFRAEIIMLHVIENIKAPSTMLSPASFSDRVLVMTTGREAAMEEKLESSWSLIAREKVFMLTGGDGRDRLKVTAKMMVGRPVAEQILKFCKESPVDIIVMGGQRLEGFSKVLALLSVSRKVSEYAYCPVVLVR